jgi:hypothetical protein
VTETAAASTTSVDPLLYETAPELLTTVNAVEAAPQHASIRDIYTTLAASFG